MKTNLLYIVQIVKKCKTPDPDIDKESITGVAKLVILYIEGLNISSYFRLWKVRRLSEIQEETRRYCNKKNSALSGEAIPQVSK
jgi:hypothetical protein